MLHIVERGCETIKKSIGRLHDLDMARRASKKHITHLHNRDYTAMWEGWKVIVADIVHDKMSHLRHRGAGSGPLRHKVEWIFYQNHINEPRMRRTTKFEVERTYKV